jgi:hypothetical protein
MLRSVIGPDVDVEEPCPVVIHDDH